jgi:predicted ATPase
MPVDARVLLLGNDRPEYQHGWGSTTSYTRLRLDPLPEAGADTLLQALLGHKPGLGPGSWARARRTRRPQCVSPPPATTARPSL